MLKANFLLLSFFFSLNSIASASEETIPVLIRIEKSQQSDTLGYNFVEQLTSIVYNEIIEGRCKLWDSQEKNIQLTGSTLKDIENSYNTAFCNQNQIFVYENWIRKKTEITTTTLGFLFSSKNAKDESVTFGYIDYSEISSVLLRVPVLFNANGCWQMNMAVALNAKYFNFNLIQFGFSVFKNSEDARIKQMEYVGGRGYNTAMFKFGIITKRITYLLERSKLMTDENSKLTENILSGLESSLKDLPSVFNKVGGYRMQNITNLNIHVSRVYITEIWSKYGEVVLASPQSVLIYIDDAPLDTLASKDIDLIPLSIDGKNMYQLLIEKKFNYVLTKINEQKIKPAEAFLFQKAFKESPWNMLNQYVQKF